MRKYGLVIIGTGSAMSLVEPYLEQNPGKRIAVIDKDQPGGICLTRGCIPTKILVYPAEVVRTLQRAQEFGIHVEIKSIDFKAVMDRMRGHVWPDIAQIREGLSSHPDVDYYHAPAEFTGPYKLRVNGEDIEGERIFLCTGSQPAIPPIEGLAEAGYFTSDTLLDLQEAPRRMIIIGAGYIGAEYGHFFSAMGTKVTLLGRNPRFLPDEEPEISAFAAKEFGRHVTLLLNHEAIAARREGLERVLVANNGATGQRVELRCDAILVATGREPTHGILHTERAGLKTDAAGWLVTNARLETNQPRIWALGDANGLHQFKHKANHEADVMYRNIFLGEDAEADYHAVPHAVFADPEVAGVGMGEADALKEVGPENLLVGFQRYEDTAKGFAMGARGFVKALLERGTGRILGCHIVGPQASVLIQEVVVLMYAPGRSAQPLVDSMHIHPALSEVVERAFANVMTVEQYHHQADHAEHDGDPGEEKA